jgi:hypothetical protein
MVAALHCIALLARVVWWFHAVHLVTSSEARRLEAAEVHYHNSLVRRCIVCNKLHCLTRSDRGTV